MIFICVSIESKSIVKHSFLLCECVIEGKIYLLLVLLSSS